MTDACNLTKAAEAKKAEHMLVSKEALELVMA